MNETNRDRTGPYPLLDTVAFGISIFPVIARGFGHRLLLPRSDSQRSSCRDESPPACDPREAVPADGDSSFFISDRVFIAIELIISPDKVFLFCAKAFIFPLVGAIKLSFG